MFHAKNIHRSKNVLNFSANINKLASSNTVHFFKKKKEEKTAHSLVGFLRPVDEMNPSKIGFILFLVKEKNWYSTNQPHMYSTDYNKENTIPIVL